MAPEQFPENRQPSEPLDEGLPPAADVQLERAEVAPQSASEASEPTNERGLAESLWYRGSTYVGKALGNLALRGGHQTAADILEFTGEVVGVAPTFIAMHAVRKYHEIKYNLTHPRPRV